MVINNNTRSFSLDALRITLAFWVFVTHLIFFDDRYKTPVLLDIIDAVFKPNNETHPAVLIFIVLSGYCIHRSGINNIKEYLLRRFWRIYPVYFLACISGFSLTYFYDVDPYSDLKNIHVILLKLTALSSVIPVGWWEFNLGNPVLSTVSAEIWIYFLYPLILFMPLKRFFYFSLILYFIGLYWVVISGDINKYIWFSNCSVAGFFPFWCIGALAHSKDLMFFWKRFFIHACIGYFVLAILVFQIPIDPIFISEIKRFLFSFLVAVLINKLDSINFQPKNKLINHISLSSYSIYAFHAPFMIIMIHYGIKTQYICLLSFFACFFMYLLLESSLFCKKNSEMLKMLFGFAKKNV